jgi:tetratricopeptide (TPR) repeat protein
MGIRKAKPGVGRKPRFKPVDIQSQVPSQQARADQLVKGDGTANSAQVGKLTKAELEADKFAGFQEARARASVKSDVKLDAKPKVHDVYDDIEGVDAPTMRNNAGWEEYKQGNLAGAEQLFLQALEEKPFPDIEKSIHNRLGATLMQSPGRLGDAQASLQRSLDIDPEYGPANYNMACVHALQGNAEMSSAYLAVAKAIDGPFFTALAARSMSGGALKAVAGDPAFQA